MNRTTLSILMLALALPASVLAAASSEESARLCPKGKQATTAAQEAESPAAATPAGSAQATKPAAPRSGTPAVRQSPQRWHSVLPGMVR